MDKMNYNIKWVWDNSMDFFNQYDVESGLAELKKLASVKRALRRRRQVLFFTISSAALLILLIGLVANSLFNEHFKNQNFNEITVADNVTNDFLIEIGEKKFVNQFVNSNLRVFQGKIIIESSQGNTIIPSTGKEVIKVHVPKGMRYNIMLEDGSAIWIGSNSSVLFPVKFSEKERRLSARGNVHFQISKNNSPFVTYINKDVSVIVYGTVFSINSYEQNDQLNAYLYEGKISMKIKDTEHILMPDQKISYNIINKSVYIEAIESKRIFWKDNCVFFENATLNDLAEEISNWFDVSAQFNNSSNSVASFTGNIPDNLNINQIVQILNAADQFKVSFNGKTLFFTTK